MELDGEFSSTAADHLDSCGAQSMDDEEIQIPYEEIPDEFLDPIQYTLMKDPVILPSRITVDRTVILKHLLTDNSQSDPFNRSYLTQAMLIPDVELKAQIEEFTRYKRLKKHGLQSTKEAVETETEHRDKRVRTRPKTCPRPYLKFEVLYDEVKWIDWALTPYDIEELVAKRNKAERNIFYIHVAGVCKESGASEFGYIIRDCHGTPISAYSEYSESVPNETKPLSESHQVRKAFYQELKAVNKSLEHAKKLGLKYVSMVSNSHDVALAVHDCGDGYIYGEHGEEIVSVYVEIMRKILEQRCSYPEVHDIFNIHAGPRRGVNPAVCVAGLAAIEGKSELDISFNKGMENMPLVKEKLAVLMGLLHTEASTRSYFHP